MNSNLSGTTRNLMRSIYSEDQVTASTMRYLYHLISLVFGCPAGNYYWRFFEVIELDEGDEVYRPDSDLNHEFQTWVNNLR